MAEKSFAKKQKEVVAKLKKDGQKVQVIGRVKNGKIEIDQASLKELERKFPGAQMSFVAVNAPFDPSRQRGS